MYKYIPYCKEVSSRFWNHTKPKEREEKRRETNETSEQREKLHCFNKLTNGIAMYANLLK